LIGGLVDTAGFALPSPTQSSTGTPAVKLAAVSAAAAAAPAASAATSQVTASPASAAAAAAVAAFPDKKSTPGAIMPLSQPVATGAVVTSPAASALGKTIVVLPPSAAVNATDAMSHAAKKLKLTTV